jgi:hypothetical protein
MMSECPFPSVIDIARHMVPADGSDLSIKRYSRAMNFAYCFWPAMALEAAKGGCVMTEDLFHAMKTLDSIMSFVRSNPDTVEADSMESYLSGLPGYQSGSGWASDEIKVKAERRHAEVITALDVTLLAALPAWEMHRRFTVLQEENRRLMKLAQKQSIALHPFAMAFEAGGLASYTDAEPSRVRFNDQNECVPSRGITMGAYRKAWEAVMGFEATNHPVVLVGLERHEVKATT